MAAYAPAWADAVDLVACSGVCAVILVVFFGLLASIFLARYRRRQRWLLESLMRGGLSRDRAKARLAEAREEGRAEVRRHGLVLLGLGLVGAVVFLGLIAFQMTRAEPAGGYVLIPTGGMGLSVILVLLGIIQLITGVDFSFILRRDNPNPVDVPTRPVGTNDGGPEREHNVCSICGATLRGSQRAVGLCPSCRQRAS